MKLFSKLVLVAGMLASMSSQAFSHGLRDAVYRVRNATYDMVNHGLTTSGYTTRYCPATGVTTVTGPWHTVGYRENLNAWTSSGVWTNDVVYLNALDASSRLYYAATDLLVLMDRGVLVGVEYDYAYDYFYSSYSHFVEFMPSCYDLVYTWPGYTVVTTTWTETFYTN